MTQNNTLSNLTKSILKNLTGRNKNIIEKRFGLFSDKKYTLQDIGNELHITRERIRQIEKESIKTLKQFKPTKEFNKFISEVKKILIANNGFCEDNKFFAILSKKYKDKNLDKFTIFLTTLNGSIIHVEANNCYKAYWAINKEKTTLIKNVLQNVTDLLSKEQKPLTTQQILERLAPNNKNLNSKILENILSINNKIYKNPIGEYGLISWSNIRPYSAKDKAYFLMKYYIKKPIHFRDLAKLIQSYEFPTLVKESNSIATKKKNINIQTVHNELIKDNRFTLIGHGQYALQEWGYTKGAIKDVIINILQASNSPLSEYEISQVAHKQRIVKDSTIHLSLSDKKLFQKTQDNKYILSKSVLQKQNTDLTSTPTTPTPKPTQNTQDKEEYKILNA